MSQQGGKPFFFSFTSAMSASGWTEQRDLFIYLWYFQ
jgi:hypothetical protein